MITVTFNGVQYQCDVAVKGSDFIFLYNDNLITNTFFGITDFGAFSISGGNWTPYAENEIIVRTATISSGLITLDDYANIETGTTIKLVAPADSATVTAGISIDGETFSIVNSMKEEIMGKSNVWAEGAIIGLLVDKSNKTTYLMNGDVSENGVGKDLTGESVKPTYTTIVTAGTGAEIFNDYRERTFGASGIRVNSGNIASGNYSHAEGACTTASGDNSHAEGWDTHASGDASHAEGYHTKAQGDYSHAEGRETTASGSQSHAQGRGTIASGGWSHAEGMSAEAIGNGSHAEGYNTKAQGNYSHAEGWDTHANSYQHTQGRFNKQSAGPTSSTDMTGDIFIIGNGTSDTSYGNALRTTTAGKTYGLDAFAASGADYAEYFEWLDGNVNAEDRRGLFVTLDGDKIRLTNSDDTYVLGVVSATPVIEGDSQSEIWKNMYLTDVFGCKLTEIVEVEETIDETTGQVIPAHTDIRWIINPEYDAEQKYIQREHRSEWSAIGLMGKLVVVDDGTCEVNGYCKPSRDGIGTKSDSGYRVMSRLDESHIRILVR